MSYYLRIYGSHAAFGEAHMATEKKRLRLALLGFGNAGRAFGELLLEEHARIEERFGVDVQVAAIVTATRGSLVNPAGIDLREALDQLMTENRFSPSLSGFCNAHSAEVVASGEYDVAVELTPLDVFTGRPALDHVRTALVRGKDVITANKGPLAHGARELIRLAKENRACFLYETTVMDGTPVFNLVEETLPFCNVVGVEGILNTTTNFILEEMTYGKTFDAAVEEGRTRGFVEADPSLDIDGWDASAKLTALMNVLMGSDIRPQDIERTGIGAIGAEDVRKARQDGKVIKLVCRGSFEGGTPKGVVRPEWLERDHPYASVKGTSSIVTLHTDKMGSITVTEHDPEIEQTGYGIFSDLIRLIRKRSVSGK